MPQPGAHSYAPSRLQLGLPIKYFQFDSWWYWKLPDKGALLLWEPMPSVFPDGMTQWLGLPLALHNRYFAPYNNYTEMVGGVV